MRKPRYFAHPDHRGRIEVPASASRDQRRKLTDTLKSLGYRQIHDPKAQPPAPDPDQEHPE